VGQMHSIELAMDRDRTQGFLGGDGVGKDIVHSLGASPSLSSSVSVSESCDGASFPSFSPRGYLPYF
jgi:hypothetical protein